MSETGEEPGAPIVAPERAQSRIAALIGAARLLWSPEAFDLILPLRHTAAGARQRAELITRRVRLIAGLFAILTLAWIVIDAYTIPWPYWGEIAIGRAIASLAFLVLAARPDLGRYQGGLWPHVAGVGEVLALIAVPLAFFLYTNGVLSISGYHGALAVSTAYFYLPFIVAVGLSIFPLTALEAAIPAALAIGAMFLAVTQWPQFLGGQSGVATVWRLVLIAGIAVLAGMSQLRFLLRLTEQATRDGLTHLLLRRVGAEMLESQFAYARRHDLPFALLFIDIDRFKSINDTYGHEAGDAVLRAAAAHLAGAFRQQDVLVRWGGEEFVVGLPGANQAQVEIALLRLAKLGIGLRPDGAPLTASIGVAERQADALDGLDALVEHADARMYEAKSAGRNRYVFKDGPKGWIGAPN
ncbi:MAG TPA: diguanylate cyclase [Dongiaceae bacterium]|nr:diguanylate cyclase [Dongiaceae bacterium]